MPEKQIRITVEVPEQLFEMQDWLGSAALPLSVVAETAIATYIHNLVSMYNGRPKS